MIEITDGYKIPEGFVELVDGFRLEMIKDIKDNRSTEWIFLIGKSGLGKSTLINLLLGNLILSGERLVKVRTEYGPIIGFGDDSVTHEPKCFELNHNKGHLCMIDLPGTLDSMPLRNGVTKMLTHKWLRKAKKGKFLMFLDGSLLDVRGGIAGGDTRDAEIDALVSMLVNLYGNDFDKEITSNIMLAVRKCEGKISLVKVDDLIRNYTQKIKKSLEAVNMLISSSLDTIAKSLSLNLSQEWKEVINMGVGVGLLYLKDLKMNIEVVSVLGIQIEQAMDYLKEVVKYENRIKFLKMIKKDNQLLIPDLTVTNDDGQPKYCFDELKELMLCEIIKIQGSDITTNFNWKDDADAVIFYKEVTKVIGKVSCEIMLSCALGPMEEFELLVSERWEDICSGKEFTSANIILDQLRSWVRQIERIKVLTDSYEQYKTKDAKDQLCVKKHSFINESLMKDVFKAIGAGVGLGGCGAGVIGAIRLAIEFGLRSVALPVGISVGVVTAGVSIIKGNTTKHIDDITFRRGIIKFGVDYDIALISTDHSQILEDRTIYIGRTIDGTLNYTVIGYELCLMSELPSNGVPELGKVYLEKQNDQRLKYVVFNPNEDNTTLTGFLDITTPLQNLTKVFLNNIRADILRITSERNHTPAISGTITTEQLPSLGSINFSLEEIKPLLPKILEITSKRGHTNTNIISYLWEDDTILEANVSEDLGGELKAVRENSKLNGLYDKVTLNYECTIMSKFKAKMHGTAFDIELVCDKYDLCAEARAWVVNLKKTFCEWKKKMDDCVAEVNQSNKNGIVKNVDSWGELRTLCGEMKNTIKYLNNFMHKNETLISSLKKMVECSDQLLGGIEGGNFLLFLINTCLPVEKPVEDRDVNYMVSQFNSLLSLSKDHSWHGKEFVSIAGDRFINTPVIGDGDCGFTTFGITREQAIVLLEEYVVTNEYVRDLLKQPLSDVITQLHFINYVKREVLSCPGYVDIANKYIAAQQNNVPTQVTLLKQQLELYKDDAILLVSYIHYDIRDKNIDEGWAHPAVLQALAVIRHLKLNIFTPNADSLLIPHEYYSTIDLTGEDNPQELNLLFINGNHFDRLERLEVEVLESSLKVVPSI